MKASAKTLIVTALVVLACSAGAYAWDVEYNASTGLLPNAASPAWQLDFFGAPSSILDGALHIGYSIDGGTDYRREANNITAGVPVTMETRMRVLSATNGAASLGMSTYSGEVHIGIFPNHMTVSDRNYHPHTFWGDFTTFHTIRCAYDGSMQAYVWVDNQLALSWTADVWSLDTGPPGGVSFGSDSSDSYWQYVDYSKAFVPVPEPSALAALGFGLVPLGGFALRRRSRRSQHPQ